MPPYERIIQWVAGPASAASGWVATVVVNHAQFAGSLGLTQQGISKALFNGIVFGVSAVVTYAGHHKWLSNAAKWWESQGAQIQALDVEDATTALPDKPESAVTPDAAPTEPTPAPQQQSV